MKEETQKKVEAAIADWQYREELPAEYCGFRLQQLNQPIEDRYDLFTYSNEGIRREVTAYYHEETHEYKLRVKIGLTEFCRIEFISPDLARFEEVLRRELLELLSAMVNFSAASLGSIVRAKNITTWEYGRNLPANLEGFELFIKPAEPVTVLNGSLIVFDYSDFSIDSNFIIYYNVFRDEFFGEARIRNIPEMNYTFDSTELSELEEKLDAHLVKRLRGIRARA